MQDALTTLVPMIAFMLLPVWIPLIAVAFGAVVELVTPGRTPAQPKRAPLRAARAAAAPAPVAVEQEQLAA